ncbi:MAG: Aldose 1-epimerase [Bacteroidota bacterium]|jgi:aldose 1-epimerase
MKKTVIRLTTAFFACTFFMGMAQSKPLKTNMLNSEKPFGQTPNNEAVTLYTLKNSKGMEVQIMNYGAIITKIMVPDKNKVIEDVVLGFDSVADYIKDSPYFGAVVGRYGNRIAAGTFSLDGKNYSLAAQNNGQHLHGGLKGFDKKVWKTLSQKPGSLTLSYLSKDGEEGFPGNLEVQVTYTLTEDNAIAMDYTAKTDQATVLNICNHSYFNLTGNVKRDVLDHTIQLNAPFFIPVDKVLIPTGEVKSVKGGPFDFTSPKKIGLEINAADEQIAFGGGYDHCYAFDKAPGAYAKIAHVEEPVSGRVMEVFTTEPGVQFYTGNNLDGHLIGKYGAKYNKRTGFCLETQHYPDSPNKPNFPSTVLRPGETYTSKTVYQFSVK